MVIGLSGCDGPLSARRIGYVEYDKSTDTIRYLRVYEHISSSGEHADEGIEVLAKAYDERHKLILTPSIMEYGVDFPFPNSFLVTSERKFLAKSFNGSPFDSSDEQDAPFSLTKIRIKPGEFYRTKRDTLGYYHQIECLGEVLDALLPIFSAAISALVEEAASEAILERKKGSVSSITWDQVADEAANAAQGWINDTPVRRPAPESHPFDDDSLRLLLEVASEKKIVITRQEESLELRFKLSDNDLKGLKKTVARLIPFLEPVKRKRIEAAQQLAAMPKGDDAIAKRTIDDVSFLFLLFLSKTSITSEGDNWVCLKVDMVELMNDYADDSNTVFEIRENHFDHQKSRATLATIEQKGIAVSA